MSERRLYQIFQRKIRKADPSAWVYKLPDTFNLGGKKPGDFFCVIRSIPFLIEMKSKKGVLTRYQAFQLTEFINAGGEALIFTEGQDMDLFIKNLLDKDYPNRLEYAQRGVGYAKNK